MTATVTVSPSNLIADGKQFYERYNTHPAFTEAIYNGYRGNGKWLINFDLIEKTIAVPKNARRPQQFWKDWISDRQKCFEELIAWRLCPDKSALHYENGLTLPYWEIEINPKPRMSDPPGWAIFDFTVKAEYTVTPEKGELIKVT